MTISNPILVALAFCISLVLFIIYTKVWMIIANFFGDKLGIGKFVVGLFSRNKRKK